MNISPKLKVPEISIVRLLHSIGLDPWERSFLKAIVYRTPTKAENIVLKAIQEKVKGTVGDQATTLH